MFVFQDKKMSAGSLEAVWEGMSLERGRQIQKKADEELNYAGAMKIKRGDWIQDS